jgi:hypothetical protein
MEEETQISQNTFDKLARNSLLPEEICDNESNKTIEVIVCTSISGGARYIDNMPETLELERTLADGRKFKKRYIQVTL